MILLSYSNSSIKILKFLTLYVCNLEENLLFSTVIFGSVFNDYVVFYGDNAAQPVITSTTSRARVRLLLFDNVCL